MALPRAPRRAARGGGTAGYRDRELSGVTPTVCRVTGTVGTSTAQHPAGCAAGPDGGSGDRAHRPALSPSRAADFKQCPLLYRLRAIDRLPEVPSPAQVRGTLVHTVLDRLYALPAAQRVPAAARALVAPAWAELCEAEPGLPAALFGGGDPDGRAGDPPPAGLDPQTWLAGAGALLDAYFALEDPRLLEPQARELRVEVERESGVVLRGYVDRVDRVGPVDPAGPEAAEPGAGDYRVVDYKTGTAPGTAGEGRALFQMKFYALMLLLLRGRAPRELRLMYLTGPVALHYAPDEEQLLRFGRTLDAMWTAIRAAGDTGDFRPNRGPACAWCSHRAVCPAWGGVPPPYPGWPADPAEPAGPVDPEG